MAVTDLHSYRIPDAETVVRGTIRYNGFPQFVKALVDIGFLSVDEQDFFKQAIPWKEALQKFIGASSSSEEDLIKTVLSKTSISDESVKSQVLAGLKWSKSKVLAVVSDRMLIHYYSWCLL